MVKSGTRTRSEELAVLEPKCGLRHSFIRDAQLCLPGNVSLLGLSALSDRELCSQPEVSPALVSSGLAVHAIFLLCALRPPIKAICGEVPSSLGCGKPVLSWLCADALAISAATCTAASLVIHRRHSLRKVLWRGSWQSPSPSLLSVSLGWHLLLQLLLAVTSARRSHSVTCVLCHLQIVTPDSWNAA